MVEAHTDDGQVLRALNEVYVGHASPPVGPLPAPPARRAPERQSSSGVLVGTGTGATGWCRSAWQSAAARSPCPGPTDPALCWFVREAWPSPATGTDLTEGVLGAGEELTLTAESDGSSASATASRPTP